MSDRAAAVSEMTFAIGQLIGPVIGGVLTDAFGFRGMTDIAGTTIFCVAVINLLVFILPDVCKKNKY